MKPLGTPWTETELETIVALRKAGNSIATVATVLDRSFESVASKVGNLRTKIDGHRPAARSTIKDRRAYRTRADFVTASLLGDPLPGRSALDQRAGQ